MVQQATKKKEEKNVCVRVCKREREKEKARERESVC